MKVSNYNNNQVNFKGIVYPVKYLEQLKTAVKQSIPDSFIELNPKYSGDKPKGFFAKIKQILGVSQPKFIIVKQPNHYSSSGGMWTSPNQKFDDTLLIHNIYKDVPSRSSRPAHEEEFAVFEKMKQNILADTKSANMSDDDFFKKFSIKYIKNDSGDKQADLEDAFRQRYGD